MAEAKTEAKEQFFLIYNDKAEQEKLGLESVSAIAKHVGVAPKTALAWVKALKGVGEGAFDKFLEACRKAGIDGKNSRYADLYATLKGWKQKPKEDSQRDGLSPADYIKIGQQVREALIDEYRKGGGMCPICHKSILLDASVCIHTESKYGAEGKVGSVGISNRPAEPVPV